MKPLDVHDEWLSLIEVSGPFLATPVLKRVFSTGLPAVEPRIRQYLRQAYDEWCEARDNSDPLFAALHRAWIHEVLARGLEYDESDSGELLLRGDHIPAELRVALPEHGVTLTPDYALVSDSKSQLLVQIYPAGTDLQAALKIDGWIASPAERMERLCRASGCRLGLATDGECWMLVDAPVGAVSTFASWYARLWGQERLTLQAFLTLLGIRRFFGANDETLPLMLDESLQHQEEVTDALGEQVRRAVEVLIQALDKEDRERSRTLLQGVEPTELYEAGLTIMMRLVFLLSAEERGLLLMGEEAYESNYAISTLRMQLRQETEEVLERRNDAWSRLLATFRAVYGGIEHEVLRLPALGGSLFDPDRFPFLEGRAKGSGWKVDTAIPLPIDNRTVLLLLEAIQQYEGRTLSYRALDVEQIGYVYEGLLERTVSRTERIMVELTGGKGAKKTLYGLEELEALHRQGDGALTDALSGADAIKRGAGAIRKDLEREADPTKANRLLTVCAGDEELRDRALPFLNLLRTDPWDYPLIYSEGAFIVTTGSDRRETGAHYTPKSLTESIVETALEPIAYVGPSEGLPREQWSLRSVAELLDLKICDPAMGSGAFLVQVCRWLAERIVDAWGAEETTGRYITSEGVAVDDLVDLEGLPAYTEDRLVIARRLVAERCLYGVDLNPLAVELAKLSIWLVTLAKGRPFGFLDHNLKCGDSLLGIHRLDQLTELSMTPGAKRQQRLFGKNIELAVRDAIELRQRLREIPIRDIHDIETMALLDADARVCLKVAERISDALIGVAFTSGNSGTALETAIASLSTQAERAINGDQEALKKVIQQTDFALSIELEGEGAMRRPFHWPLEFPEVFVEHRLGFDAFVGNPPFVFGKNISATLGGAYNAFLVKTNPAASRNVDLCAHFFYRAFILLCETGTQGMLATSSIAEGASRLAGLESLISSGGSIYSAVSKTKWPGAAKVLICQVSISKSKWGGLYSLDGKIVEGISSFLTPEANWQPLPLRDSKGIAFYGAIPNGDGFFLSRAEGEAILLESPSHKSVLYPFLTGKDLNSSSSQTASRYAINFWDWAEEDAAQYLDAYQIAMERVKPYRQTLLKSKPKLAQKWWLYEANPRGLHEAIGRGEYFRGGVIKPALEKVLVIARVSSTNAFTFVSTDQVFDCQLIVIASDHHGLFAILQSSIHFAYAWQHGGKMKFDLRYSPTMCLATFPFPNQEAQDSLRLIGESFNDRRQTVLLNRGWGLTRLANFFNDPDCNDEDVQGVRSHLAELDQQVLEVYGWIDIELKHGFHHVGYLPEGKNIRYTICETARSEVLRRLSELNRQRHEEETVIFSRKSTAKPMKSSRKGGQPFVQATLAFVSEPPPVIDDLGND